MRHYIQGIFIPGHFCHTFHTKLFLLGVVYLLQHVLSKWLTLFYHYRNSKEDVIKMAWNFTEVPTLQNPIWDSGTKISCFEVVVDNYVQRNVDILMSFLFKELISCIA